MALKAVTRSLSPNHSKNINLNFHKEAFVVIKYLVIILLATKTVNLITFVINTTYKNLLIMNENTRFGGPT